MSGLSGWLLCLVNLLVFSAIGTARCLYCRCEVLVLSLRGACTIVARYLYCRCKAACTIAARRLVLSLQGGLYYHNMVLVTPVQAA